MVPVVPCCDAEFRVQDDAYEHCLDGVAGIVHTATPVVFGLDDPAEYYKPAIQGTMKLLKTAAKHRYV